MKIIFTLIAFMCVLFSMFGWLSGAGSKLDWLILGLLVAIGWKVSHIKEDSNKD